MATAAQIEANRRNAKLSTGTTTYEGKNRARCNALKHGMAALTIMPALPQEDPQESEARFQEGTATCNRKTPPSASWSARGRG